MAALLSALLGAVYGFSVAQFQIFPFHLLQNLKTAAGGQTAQGKQLGQQASLYETFHPQRDVVMLGDSLTAFGPWADMFPQVQPANRGISGDTTLSIKARLSTVKALKPKRVFIMAGINDFAVAAQPQATFATYHSIVSELQSAGAQVVVQSTLPCDSSRRIGWLQEGCATVNEKVARFNNLLQTLPGVRFVDLRPTMANQNGLRPDLTSDGVHLNTAGYVVWRNSIEALIEESPTD